LVKLGSPWTILAFYVYYILLIQYKPLNHTFSDVLKYSPLDHLATPISFPHSDISSSSHDSNQPEAENAASSSDDSDRSEVETAESVEEEDDSKTKPKDIKPIFDFLADAKSRGISTDKAAPPHAKYASKWNITTFPTKGCRYPNPARKDKQTHAFIIGPQKTGTTFLTDLLVGVTDKNFPDIFGSTPKETGFYLKTDLKDSKAYHDFIWPGNDPKKYDVLLEASASNILKKSFLVIRKIAKEPKYIMLLRDPTKRYFSELNHVHRKFYGADKSNKPNSKRYKDVEAIHDSDDLHKQTIRQLGNGKRSNFLSKGNYAELLNGWKHVHCNSILLIDQKDITVDVIKEVLKHIGAKIPSDDIIQESMEIARDKYKREYGSGKPEWHTLPKPLPQTVEAVDIYYEERNKELWEMLNIDIPWF